MKIKSLFVGLLSLAMFASCSDDVVVDNPGNPDGNGNTVADGSGVYMQVVVSMPEGSRSFTSGPGSSTGGSEVGSDAENRVSSMLIVLAKQSNNEYIAHALVDNSIVSINNGKSYSAKGKISKSDLADYYAGLTGGAHTDIHVFVFCNPTSDLLEVFSENVVAADWYNAMCQLGEGESIWANNYFLMSNSEIATRTLPKSIDDWNPFSVETNPFNLSGVNSEGEDKEINNGGAGKGAVKVERACARFDFRDGSKDIAANAEFNLPANTYPVVRHVNEDGTIGDVHVNIKLNKMLLVNMSNSFYFLRRVSANGTPTNSILCGSEMPWYTDNNGLPVPGLTGNYVVDAYAQEKMDGVETQFSKYFNYSFFDDNGVCDNTGTTNRWYLSRIEDVLKNGNDDNPDWDTDKKYGDYKVWRYVTENTIPGEARNQVNGITTGVVFKGKMEVTEELKNSADEYDQALYNAIANVGDVLVSSKTRPIIYAYSNILYCSWPNIRQQAISVSYSADTQEWNRTNTLYKAVFGNGGTGEDYDELAEDTGSANYLWNQWDKDGRISDAALLAFKKAATGSGITIYQASNDVDDGWGYYCYYYYWNRHNDNNVASQMGPMEFAVVRNNVYKLAVTNIKQLGHPRISENDPEPPTPDTPNEKGDVYLTVECEVLPWVVRVNNIEF
ncbi:MAG: Mfa1 family fimbria major subunit [Paramuribaculum sp.]|nr:Mfa1 family fimbria major subunit [Paramuribaculum sp.]